MHSCLRVDVCVCIMYARDVNALACSQFRSLIVCGRVVFCGSSGVCSCVRNNKVVLAVRALKQHAGCKELETH